jgi:hypothetical protein
MTMQKRLTKKERFFNNITLTADDEVYVGIDVHKINTHPLDSVGHLPPSRAYPSASHSPSIATPFFRFGRSGLIAGSLPFAR